MSATPARSDAALPGGGTDPVTVIALRPIGSPLPLGMAGLAIASLVQSGYDLHWIARKQSLMVGLVLIAVPFSLQFLASVFSYLARDGSTGSALGVQAASWLAIALVDIAGHGHRSGALGLMLFASGGLLLGAALVLATIKPLPAAVFLVIGIRFALSGIYEVGAPHIWGQVAGIAGLVAVGLAAYAMVAFDFEGSRHRPILPTLRRHRANAAVSGNTAEALNDLVHDPGVRQMI